MTGTMTTPSLTDLARRFKASEVSKNPKGFHYVSIDATINRFNEVLGTAWSLHVEQARLDLLPPESITYGRNEKPGYLAQVTATISALGSSRGGTGSDFADDPDKALKTAQAEAMKKAGHQFGVGLYLWDARERELVDAVKASSDVKGLKLAVQMLAEIDDVDLTLEGITGYYGFDPSDEDGCVAILANAGLL